MRRLLTLLIAIASLALIAFGCGKDSVTSPRGTGTVRVSLTDAPADYDSVVLVIREVSVHREGPDEEGWASVALTGSVFDLLLLRNGVFVNLGAATVPAGRYTQVRLILDPGSYVVVNGVRHDLVVPSGLQTGLKLVGGFDVPEGGVTDIGIDFDAAQSVHVTGSGRYMLRPTARIQTMAATGAITGSVTPADPASTISAIRGSDTEATTTSSASGTFTLTLLPPGTYDVKIDAPAGMRDTTLTGVAVTAGHTTDVGTVTLTPQ